MIKKFNGLLLAKGKSKRLENKNKLDFHGKPMYLHQTIKCLKIFDKVYVSSDDNEILWNIQKVGAIPISRPKELCGDTPNIPVYRHAIEFMEGDGLVAVQVNSPTIEPMIIESVKMHMESDDVDEIITYHEDGSVYGSVWALTRERLKHYKDFYNPNPDGGYVDNSIDIHTEEDYNKAIQCRSTPQS